MTLRDSYGEIEASIGEYFKIGEATLEVVCPNPGSGYRMVWCRVVKGAVAVDEGLKAIWPAVVEMDAREVLQCIQEYRLLNGTAAPARPQQPAQTGPKVPRARNSTKRAESDQPTTKNMFD